jgi:hypothetical protein
MSTEPPAFGRIVRAYAIAQVVAMFVPFVLLLFGIKVGSGTNLVGSLIAAMYAANVFVKTYGRAPTADERRRLVWLTFATCWAIALAAVGVMVLLGGQATVDMFKGILQTLPGAVLTVVFIVISGLYLAAFQIAYGHMARSFEKKLAIKRP